MAVRFNMGFRWAKTYALATTTATAKTINQTCYGRFLMSETRGFMLRPVIDDDYEWTWVSVSKTNLAKEFSGLTKKEAWKCASRLSFLIRKENKRDKRG